MRKASTGASFLIPARLPDPRFRVRFSIAVDLLDGVRRGEAASSASPDALRLEMKRSGALWPFRARVRIVEMCTDAHFQQRMLPGPNASRHRWYTFRESIGVYTT